MENRPTDDNQYGIIEIVCNSDEDFIILEDILKEFNLDYEIRYKSLHSDLTQVTKPIMTEFYEKMYTILINQESNRELFAAFLIQNLELVIRTLNSFLELDTTKPIGDSDSMQSAKEIIQSMITVLNKKIDKGDDNNDK